MALRANELARAFAGEPIDEDMLDDDNESDETDSSGGGMQLDTISVDGEVPGSETPIPNPPNFIPSEFQVELTTRAPDARRYGTGTQEQPTEGLIYPTMDPPAQEGRASEGRREETWVRSKANEHPTQGFMRPVSDKRPSPENSRTPMSEEEHAALTVLNDDELLMMYALKSGHTIPQTRRRFQAMLLASGDTFFEEELFSGRFVIPEARADLVPELINDDLTTGALGLNNTRAYCVPARWTQKFDEPNDHQGEKGWISPESGKVCIKRLNQPRWATEVLTNW